MDLIQKGSECSGEQEWGQERAMEAGQPGWSEQGRDRSQWKWEHGHSHSSRGSWCDLSCLSPLKATCRSRNFEKRWFYRGPVTLGQWHLVSLEVSWVCGRGRAGGGRASYYGRLIARSHQEWGLPLIGTSGYLQQCLSLL